MPKAAWLEALGEVQGSELGPLLGFRSNFSENRDENIIMDNIVISSQDLKWDPCLGIFPANHTPCLWIMKKSDP
jgi:hypothetical protein